MNNSGLSSEFKVKIFLISMVVFSISAVGLSYAYFNSQIIGNDEASSMSATTKDLSITFTDGNNVNISNIYPNTTMTKTFSVRNDSSTTMYYDIKMEDVYTTYIKDELVYTLSATNSGKTRSTQTIMPNNDGLIAGKIAINAGVTQTYTMTIKWKETSDYQDYNQNATYTGKIQILSPYSYTNSVVNNINFVDRIMLDNTEAYPINTSSKYVTSSSGINFANPSDYAYNGYFAYEKAVSYTSNANKSLGTTMSLDATSGMFKLTGTTGTSKTYSEADIGKFTCYNTNSANCYANPQEVYKILEVDGSTVTRVDRYVAKPNTSSWNGLGLYQTSTNTEGNQPTYFFRGHVVNNYVSFAGDVWRIVRINEDGSIRLIRQANYGNSKFSSATKGKQYLGFMNGTADAPLSNASSSTIKAKTEAYYNAKLTSYASYLEDAGFCGDRTIQTAGTTQYYNGRARLYSAKTPRFSCPDETNDLYTLSGSSKGNGALTYPVGLITADELYYAGAVYAKISKYYLDISASFWTMTPNHNTSSGSYNWYGLAGGYITYASVTGSYSTRPVINLKADTLYNGGAGTSTDPYTVTR